MIDDLAPCVGARGPRSWDWAAVERFLLRAPERASPLGPAYPPEILALAAK
jgi:hypothetical protein